MESLLYVYGLQHAAYLAEYIGRMDTASEYRERAMQVQKAIRQLCRQPDGLLADGPCALLMEEGEVPALHSSQQVQVFGVLTGTLDVESSRRNLKKVAEEKDIPSVRWPCAFISSERWRRPGSTNRPTVFGMHGET